MDIIVCVKQIPDPGTSLPPEVGTRWLIPATHDVLDETDRYGVELGLQLAQITGGTVTLITVGRGGADHGVRQAIAMGADRAILVEDDDPVGSDALTTARLLAAAIGRQAFDLVITGTDSTDGYSGVVPQMVAELLDVPALTYATAVDVSDGHVTIHRQTSTGHAEVIAGLPAVVSVTAGAVDPRYPTFRGLMEAKRKRIDQVTGRDLDVARDSDLQVASLRSGPERASGVLLEDDGQAHVAIVDLLVERGVI